MTDHNKRLRLCRALLALNLVFIWGNSLLPGELSAALSNWVRSLLDPNHVGGSHGAGLIRKLAHFGEFMTLGACLWWLFALLGKRRYSAFALPAGCGLLAALIDEGIQLLIPERGPSLKDVGIDTAGVLVGIVIISRIRYKTFLEDHKV